MAMMEKDDRSVTEMVISAVADEEGVDERELGRPLYEVVDPDALDMLFRDGGGSVHFEYLGYDVTVTYGPSPSVDVSTGG